MWYFVSSLQRHDRLISLERPYRKILPRNLGFKKQPLRNKRMRFESTGQVSNQIDITLGICAPVPSLLPAHSIGVGRSAMSYYHSLYLAINKTSPQVRINAHTISLTRPTPLNQENTFTMPDISIYAYPTFS